MATSPKKRKPPAKKAPAKDLKAGDTRKKFAEGPKKKAAPKASSGTLTERMGEAKNRPNKGLPARTGQSRGNLNKANPPKEIRLGGQGGTGRSMTKAGYLDKFKPIPLGDRPKLLAGPARKAASGIGGTLARGAFRAVGGPAAMLISMTTEAGRGSDKPSGPLFSPSKNRAAGKGNPKAVNPYKAPKTKLYPGAYMNGGRLGGLFKPRIDSRNADMSKVKAPAKSVASNSYFKDVPSYKGAKAPVNMAGGGVNKPESKAKDFKEKNLAANQKVGKKNKPAASVKTAAPKPMTFQTAVRRNEAESYTRNKMRSKGNLLDLIRNKKK